MFELPRVVAPLCTANERGSRGGMVFSVADFAAPLSARFGRSWSYEFSAVVSSLVSDLPTVFYPVNFGAISLLFSSLELSRVWSLYRTPFFFFICFLCFQKLQEFEMQRVVSGSDL